MDPTRLLGKLKLKVLSAAVVVPGVMAIATAVEWTNVPDVAVRVMGVEGVVAAFEAVSIIWPDCPGMILIVDGEAVTPEGRPLTPTLMTPLKLLLAVAANAMAWLGPPSITERAVGVTESMKLGSDVLHPNISASEIKTKQEFLNKMGPEMNLVIDPE
jgi:hypothetical protein